MNQPTTRVAIFPGTFDPITNGHLDVIERGQRLFDKLIVAVGDNPEKKSLFTQPERAEMIVQLVAGCANVEVKTFEGLTVDFAKKAGAQVILRGIRNSSDLQFEFQVALTNRVVAGVETVFVMSSQDTSFLSSHLIKEAASLGGDISKFVPPLVEARLKEKLHPG